MEQYCKSQDELINDQQKKYKKVKKADWKDEVKALKKKAKNG